MFSTAIKSPSNAGFVGVRGYLQFREWWLMESLLKEPMACEEWQLSVVDMLIKVTLCYSQASCFKGRLGKKSREREEEKGPKVKRLLKVLVD